MTEASPNIELLLRHQDWVRQLARSLVADPSRADDVAQLTMLEAVTRAPRDLREPKGWLARVTRNAARALQRQEGRRRRREQVVASATAGATAPDPSVTVQRAAAHKRVVDALFAVPEPYHTVLLLRYFEDVDAHEIARRLERPVATVRTQLQRGLDRMRQQLDGEFGGDRAAWCAALLPLCAAPKTAIGVPVLTTIGALLMTKWILFVATAVALSLLLRWQFADLISPPMPAGVDAPTVAAATADPGATTRPGEPRREVVAATQDSTQEPATTAEGLRGRVVTPDGAPWTGLVLAWQDPAQPRLRGRVLVVGSSSTDLDQPGLREQFASPQGEALFAARFGPHAATVLALLRGEALERPRAVSDGFGRFAFEVAVHVDQLVAEQEGMMLYGAGRLPGEADPVLVVGPAVTFGGRVHDPDGQPIAEAYVHLGYQLDALPGIGARLHDTPSYRSWNANSDAGGAFELGQVPAHAGLTVTVQKRGYHTQTFATADVTGPVYCTLRRAPPPSLPVLSGTVRHRDGRPAVGARVDFGQDGGVAGDDGRFSFQLTVTQERTPLTAWLPGLQPCIVDGIGQRFRGDRAAGVDLELRLGGEALTITGRVLDADGAPFAGLRVVAVGATFLGSSDRLLEDLIGGQRNTTTDAAGRFELRGLAAHDYKVRAVQPRTLLVIESASVAAGTTEVELREPQDAFVERLEGVVVDRFGQPVMGADVSLSAMLLEGPRMSKSLPRRDGVRTGSDGRFVIEHCPRRGVQMIVEGERLASTKAEVPADGAPLRIEIVRRMRFRLQALGGVVATSFEVRDERGEVLFTTTHRPGVRSTSRQVPLGGEPPVYEVDDRAARIVWFGDGREVLAQPLVLRTDDVVEIAY